MWQLISHPYTAGSVRERAIQSCADATICVHSVWFRLLGVVSEVCIHSIVAEAQDLFNRGFREVTLLGQNVDSYKWSEEENNKARLEKNGIQQVITFANLLKVYKVHPDLRV